VSPPPTRPRLSLATGSGLFVALVIPFLTFAVGWLSFGATQSGRRVAAGLLLHWLTFAALIAIVLLWERQPLASIGVRPMRWWTIPAGVLAGAVAVVLTGVIVNTLGIRSDTRFVAYLQSLPFITRLLLAVTAGVFEETLYRGYAIERLTMLSGNKWLAGVVALIFFTLAHVPAVGVAGLLPVCIVSILVTLLYLWRRDLILNMIAHATVDAIGLLLAPIAGHGVH
jgi:membrane protease YdiL (CAAX protease family)